MHTVNDFRWIQGRAARLLLIIFLPLLGSCGDDSQSFSATATSHNAINQPSKKVMRFLFSSKTTATPGSQVTLQVFERSTGFLQNRCDVYDNPQRLRWKIVEELGALKTSADNNSVVFEAPSQPGIYHIEATDPNNLDAEPMSMAITVTAYSGRPYYPRDPCF